MNDESNYESITEKLFQENLKRFLNSAYTWETCGFYSDKHEFICRSVRPYLSAEDFESFAEPAKLAEEIMKKGSSSEDYVYSISNIVQITDEEEIETLRAKFFAKSESTTDKAQKKISIIEQTISQLKQNIAQLEEQKSKLREQLGTGEENLISIIEQTISQLRQNIAQLEEQKSKLREQLGTGKKN